MKRTLSLLVALLVSLTLFQLPVAWAQEPGAVAGNGDIAAAADATPEEDRVSISFTEASIQAVLQSLASMREGVNIVIDPGITGQVSFQLEDVPWDTALKLVTDMHGLQVTKEKNNIYRVSRPSAPMTSDLVIELHTPETIALLTDEEAIKLAADPSLTAEEALAFLSANPQAYISRIIADDQPAVDVVNELARKASLNFAFSSDFQAAPPTPGQPTPPAKVLPPISLNLRNISLEEALQLIAEQGKLTCVNRNGVWMVSPFKAESAQLEPLKMETFTINYLPLDEELVRILQTLCSEREKVTRGKNKILIVRATADTIDAIRDTLLVMDRPTPQVLIEARIFQVNDGFGSETGINWQDLGNEDGFAIEGEFVTDPDSGIDDITGATADQIVDFKDFELDTAVRYATLSWPDFTVVLHALQTSDNAKQIANPKIVCNSDEQAFIHIGPQRPIIKATTDGSGDSVVRTYELDGDYGAEEVAEVNLGTGEAATEKRTYTTNKGYLDLGTKLTVFPSVKTEEEVYLRVMPELVRNPTDAIFGEGTINEVSYPVLFRTFVRSQFTIKSGQTVAIGGLIDEQEKENQNGIPLLQDIPWLGKYLFSYTSKSSVRTETLIFLTVKVLSGKELSTTSGLPIRTSLIQDEVNRIQDEDANGAEYDEMKAQELLEAAQAAEGKKLETRTTNAIKNLLGIGKDEAAATSEEPESYLEEE